MDGFIDFLAFTLAALICTLATLGVVSCFKYLAEAPIHQKVCLEAKYKNYILENCEGYNDQQ